MDSDHSSLNDEYREILESLENQRTPSRSVSSAEDNEKRTHRRKRVEGRRRTSSSSSSSSSSESSSSSSSSNSSANLPKRKSKRHHEISVPNKRLRSNSSDREREDIVDIHPDSEDINVIADAKGNNNKDGDNTVYASLTLVTAEEEKGPKVNDEWAKMLDKQWTNQKSIKSMKPLLEKYLPPENCKKIEIPKMNEEILNLLSSFQRKNDFKYIGMQKSLRAGASAAIQLGEYLTNSQKVSTSPSMEKVLQFVLDIVAVLGRTSSDLSEVRRKHAVSVLRPEFKCLSKNKPSNKKLFGDEISKSIREINAAKRVEKRKSTSSYYSATNKKPFLGNGRASSKSNWHNNQSYSKRSYQNQPHNQNRKKRN